MHRHPLVAAFDLVVCLALMFIILALTSIQQKPSIPTFGRFAVTTTWPGDSNDDVDVYVRDPLGDICFFGNLSTGGMHLEHDDLGRQNSNTVTLPNGQRVVSSYNGERTIISSIIPGEYTVNIHMYKRSSPAPVAVTVQLWNLQGNDSVLLTRRIVLRSEGDEKTVWRFTLDAAGHVRNVNERPVQLVFHAYEHGSNPGFGAYP